MEDNNTMPLKKERVENEGEEESPLMKLDPEIWTIILEMVGPLYINATVRTNTFFRTTQTTDRKAPMLVQTVNPACVNFLKAPPAADTRSAYHICSRPHPLCHNNEPSASIKAFVSGQSLRYAMGLRKDQVQNGKPGGTGLNYDLG